MGRKLVHSEEYRFLAIYPKVYKPNKANTAPMMLIFAAPTPRNIVTVLRKVVNPDSKATVFTISFSGVTDLKACAFVFVNVNPGDESNTGKIRMILEQMAGFAALQNKSLLELTFVDAYLATGRSLNLALYRWATQDIDIYNWTNCSRLFNF